MGHAASTGGEEIYRVMVGKPEGKKPLRIPTRRLDNIKMSLTEIRFEGVHCIKLLQARDKLRALVDTVLNLRVP